MRGATGKASGRLCAETQFQSTHPMRGATFCKFEYVRVCRYFNPRTPCGVRRNTLTLRVTCLFPFQSTHPMRGATLSRYLIGVRLYLISIHAPLAGCDFSQSSKFNSSPNFNPRTPRGVRHRFFPTGFDASGFQSTHPSRGATDFCTQAACDAADFNPRTPRGVRRLRFRSALLMRQFQSTHPSRGATSQPKTSSIASNDFNPRTPRGVRHTCGI